jgi:uncharacterized protein YkwD
VAALVCALAAAPASASRRDACPGANTATSDAGQLQRALLCLTNAERRRHGLSQMSWNRALARVAGAHARDMVARHYFAHVSPGGADQMDRIAASSYKPAVGCWTAGENLLLSTGIATPAWLLAAWMHSPAHRATILLRGWHDFGLGVAGASPQGDRHGLTLVALYGRRSKRLCG